MDRPATKYEALEVHEHMLHAWQMLSTMSLREIDEAGLLPLATALSKWLDNIG